MKVGIVFPGQGTLEAGFLHELGDRPEARRTLEQASDAIGSDVLELDSESALRSTVSAQLALVIAGAAFQACCVAEGIEALAVAGMSVGAYAAAIAAAAIDLKSALLLVRHRARLMEDAYPPGTYGMLAVGGMRLREVKALIEGLPVVIANYNTPSQHVLAGPTAELETVRQRALGQNADMARLLGMSVASHTPALLPAAEALMQLAMELPFHAPQTAMYSGRTGRRLLTAQAVREELAWNLAYPVTWTDTVGALGALGVEMMVEAPPGHVLTRLTHQILPEVAALAASETRWDVLLREMRRR